MSEAAVPTIQTQIAHVFPTLIGRFQISNTEATNKALLQVLLEQSIQIPSHDYANAGGWHSSGNLLEWSMPEVTLLRSWIAEALESNGASNRTAP